METLAALSLAGTILEFTRFGIDLLSDGRELYKSSQGVLTANEQLELATADLRVLLVKLGARQRSTPTVEDEEDENSFQHILQGAEVTAKELSERLEGLKVKGAKSRKWESVRKAVQSVWTRDEIESLTKKLARYKGAVKYHVLVSIL
jgi:fructose-bisphosphate aldolase class 1